MICSECNLPSEQIVQVRKPKILMKTKKGHKELHHPVKSANLCYYHRKKKEGLFSIDWAEVRERKGRRK